jgi:hypothetical protein
VKEGVRLKGEELTRLFEKINKQENTSIEFETVWRKANRQSWLDKYFRSLKHNLAILCTLLILAPVIGSFVVNSPALDSDPNDAEANNKQDVVKGKTKRLENEAVLIGESSLPAGSIIQLKLLKDDYETVVEEKEIRIDNEGSIQQSFTIPADDENYVVMLELYPHLQSESVQDQIGQKGENLYSSSQVNGVYHYFIDNELYTGIRLYGDADKEYLNQDKTMFGSLKSGLP